MANIDNFRQLDFQESGTDYFDGIAYEIKNFTKVTFITLRKNGR